LAKLRWWATKLYRFSLPLRQPAHDQQQPQQR
jgi:hypothetical protein